MKSETKEYLTFLKNSYDKWASQWTLDKRDPVVGSYDKHNQWSDYKDYLFKGIDTSDKIALDYGCGPGRNIVNMNTLFSRIDGCDISEVNKEKAILNAKHYNITDFNYYVCDGDNIPCEDKQYDIVFSVICLQHICIHDVRYSIMEDVYRFLKPGGYFCWQMGYGGKPPRTDWSTWYENIYGAKRANGGYDVSILDENEVKSDILKIGFKTFDFDIRPTGPSDNHHNWIFMRAQKL
jgi:ubiquinone/menaquinone biosynthesis C-methylase UbiE